MMHKGRRIGPCMAYTVRMVAMHPGIRQYTLSRMVGPHGSNVYGYRTVRRTFGAGLINIDYDPDRRGWTKITLTDAGREWLASQR